MACKMADKKFREIYLEITNDFCFRPNAKKDKKPGFNSGKEVKSKVASRINTNFMKLKLLDATRKAIIDKTKKAFESAYTQTDAIKTKLCKDVETETEFVSAGFVDASTETDVELVSFKTKDGTFETKTLKMYRRKMLKPFFLVIVTSTCAMNTDNVVTDT